MDARWDPARLTTNAPAGRLVPAAVLILYVLLTGFVTVRHEPWRDEADAWLVARDSSLVEMIPAWTSNAGTPALWYLALKPLVKLGLPYSAENGLNLIFCWGAVGLVLFLAPLTLVTRILVASSYFFAFEYAVVARSYALSILLLFVACSAFHKRPLLSAVAVALAANTNVHGALIAAAFLIATLVGARVSGSAAEGTPRRRPVIIIAIGLLLAALQLAFPTGGSPHPIGDALHPEAIPRALGQAFFTGLPGVLPAILGSGLILLLVAALRTRPDALVVLAVATIALLALFALVNFGGLRHSGLLLATSLAAIWIAGDVPVSIVTRASGLLLNAGLVASAVSGGVMARADLRFAFSGSREMAAYIQANNLQHLPIAAHTHYTAEALLPYLPGTKLWYPARQEFGTYMRWTADEQAAIEMPYEVAIPRAIARFGNTHWLLLLNTEMREPERHGFHLLHRTSVPVFRRVDERYWLYSTR